MTYVQKLRPLPREGRAEFHPKVLKFTRKMLSSQRHKSRRSDEDQTVVEDAFPSRISMKPRGSESRIAFIADDLGL